MSRCHLRLTRQISPRRSWRICLRSPTERSTPPVVRRSRRGSPARPSYRALYERERRAVEILHRARATDRAPAALRARIEAERPSARVRTAPAGDVRRGFRCGDRGGGARRRPDPPVGDPRGSVGQRGGRARAPRPGPGGAGPGSTGAEPAAHAGPPATSTSPTGHRNSAGSRSGSGSITSTAGWRSPCTTSRHGHLIAYTIVQAPALATPPARASPRCAAPRCGRSR